MTVTSAPSGLSLSFGSLDHRVAGSPVLRQPYGEETYMTSHAGDHTRQAVQ